MEYKISALLIVNDTEVKLRDTIYGKTEFLQLVGLTASKVDAVIADHDNIPKLLQMMIDDGNPDFVTDMKRTKSYM